jgi:hypothetical protein
MPIHQFHLSRGREAELLVFSGLSWRHAARRPVQQPDTEAFLKIPYDLAEPDWVMPSLAAARVKLPSLATARKARRSLASSRVIDKPVY